MTTLVFGLMMLVVGMGGTLLTLGLLTMLIHGLTALLPPGDEMAGQGGKSSGENG